MELESYWERYLTHTQIQQNGAVSNLGDGINSGDYKDGKFERPPFVRLTVG